MFKTIKGENMVLGIHLTLHNVINSAQYVLNSFWGQITVLAMFIGATLGTISGLIHIIILLTLLDMFFGILVNKKVKGIGGLLSSRFRNSLYKMFFYLLFLILLFLIERELIIDLLFTPKVAFSVISAVELWSIAANILILMPNFPFLRIFRRYLVSEIGKKLELDTESVEDLLNFNICSNDKEED